MITAILLAAGASSRMGRAKLELVLGGRTVFERSLSVLLDSSVDRVVVVQATSTMHAGSSSTRVRWVTNLHPENGMASSIRTGLAARPEGTAAVLIALADKPLLKPATVNTLMGRFLEAGATIVYPTYRGAQGHPVLIASDLFVELERLQGDSGAKSLLRKFATRAVAIETEDQGILLDIDTPEDYAMCVKRLEQ